MRKHMLALAQVHAPAQEKKPKKILSIYQLFLSLKGWICNKRQLLFHFV